MEPHTKAKHSILSQYLAAWFPILGNSFRHIVYIDGFACSGRYSNGDIGSPLIAINTIINNPNKLKADIDFVLIEEREDRFKHLGLEIKDLKIPANCHIYTELGKFENKIHIYLIKYTTDQTLIIPIFAFLDPTGFEGLPYTSVRSILENKSCEVFITFMRQHINRFLEHPDDDVRQHILNLFGTDHVLDIARLPADRLNNLRLLYQGQLRKLARFVQYFELRDSKNLPLYDLFFATNHPRGFVKMKEAMWDVDPEGNFSFSDLINPDQMVLFKDNYTKGLSKILQEHFTGRKSITGKEIREYAEYSTFYINRHKTETLKFLKGENKLEVHPFKVDGSKYSSGFPDDCLITFL